MVLLSLAVHEDPAPTYAALARRLGLTASEAHAAIERAVQAGLARKRQGGKPLVLREPLRRFVLHGAAFAFPAASGGPTRGMPTAYAAPPLVDRITQPDAPPPVWPDKDGTALGAALYPLYPSAPAAARRDPSLYEVLALFDALRAGRARERALAAELLGARLS